MRGQNQWIHIHTSLLLSSIVIFLADSVHTLGEINHMGGGHLLLWTLIRQRPATHQHRSKSLVWFFVRGNQSHQPCLPESGDAQRGCPLSARWKWAMGRKRHPGRDAHQVPAVPPVRGAAPTPQCAELAPARRRAGGPRVGEGVQSVCGVWGVRCAWFVYGTAARHLDANGKSDDKDLFVIVLLTTLPKTPFWHFLTPFSKKLNFKFTAHPGPGLGQFCPSRPLRGEGGGGAGKLAGREGAALADLPLPGLGCKV